MSTKLRNELQLISFARSMMSPVCDAGMRLVASTAFAAIPEEGCNVLEKIDESEYGKFAWVIDPEGNKVELWQPPAGQ
jgi:hypothetical protein